MSEIIAKSRYVKSSPRKLRAVAKLVKDKTAENALIVLRFTPKKAAGILAKTIKSALYNGVNNFSLDKHLLLIKSITVDQGPTMKRFRAMARGSANVYRKQTSHITVILTSITPATKKTSDQPASTQKKTVSTKTTISKKKTSKKTAPKGSKTEVKVQTRKARKTAKK